MRTLLLIFVTIVISATSNAQQFGILTSHMYNQNLLNAAETGNDGSMEASLLTRKKLTGFKGAPQWIIFNAHSAFRNENIAAGFTLIRFTAGHATRNTFVFNYRYRVNIARNKYVQFGLSTSLENEFMNWTDAIANDTDDPILSQPQTNRFRPNFGVACYLKFRQLYGGLAIPTFLNTIEGGYDQTNQAQLRINSFLGYTIVDNRELQIKAELLTRSYEFSKYLIESSVYSSFNQLLDIGLGYRSNRSYFATIGSGLNEQIRFSYSFDVFNSNFIANPAYYHEINLRYVLVYKNKAKNTSFIGS